MLRSLFLHRIALLALALCATPAHSTGLTLNCRYETVIDDRTLRHAPAGGGFAARVFVPIGGEGAAVIEASGAACSRFEGRFSKLQIVGECQREGPMEIFTLLHINLLSGAFEQTVTMNTEEAYTKTWSGHCTAGKKLF